MIPPSGSWSYGSSSRIMRRRSRQARTSFLAEWPMPTNSTNPTSSLVVRHALAPARSEFLPPTIHGRGRGMSVVSRPLAERPKFLVIATHAFSKGTQGTGQRPPLPCLQREVPLFIKVSQSTEPLDRIEPNEIDNHWTRESPYFVSGHSYQAFISAVGPDKKQHNECRHGQESRRYSSRHARL